MLLKRLWPLCEKVSKRLKAGDHAGRTVVLKLKHANHRTITRSKTIDSPTQMAHKIFDTAKPLLEKEADGRAYRLIGIGVSELEAPEGADQPELFDAKGRQAAKVERAVDAVRAKLGDDAIKKASQLD